MGIVVTTIEDCMRRSGGNLEQDVHVPTPLLEEAVESANEGGNAIDRTSSLFVNQVTFTVPCPFPTYSRLICSAYVEGSEPEVCTLCHHWELDENPCVNDFEDGNNQPENHHRRSLSMFLFCWTLSILVFVLSMFSFVYYQHTKHFLRSRVQQVVAGTLYMVNSLSTCAHCFCSLCFAIGRLHSPLRGHGSRGSISGCMNVT